MDASADVTLPADWPRIDLSLRDGLTTLRDKRKLGRLFSGLPPDDVLAILGSWECNARRDQLPPIRAQGGAPWSVWLNIGGRGAGKTRTGAEWVRGMALGLSGFASLAAGRIALVGETAADVREVMVEGVSGLLSVHGANEAPKWEPSRKRLEWKNGAVAQCFSAEDPEALRGPQFEAAWCDELGKWRQDQATWDMLQFGLRLGAHPRICVTTTPRPTALMKRLLADPKTAVSRASTKANAGNLAPAFLATVTARYGGTRLGRQELDGEMVEDTAGALWTRAMIEAARGERPAALRKIVVAVDPPASSGKRADACGIVAAGIDAAGVIHVLEDACLAQARPAQWAAVALALYHRLDADVLVAEVNQGGEMVAAVIGEADRSVPVKMVRATRGNYLRAAPVAQLYEQGRVRHAGTFPALEDERCACGPEGLASGRSPDRLDALVWAVSALGAGEARGVPRVRGV